MATLTIRNLDEGVKDAIRLRAARNKRSMEEEARMILKAGVGEIPNGKRIADMALKLFGKKNGIDLDLPPRPKAVPEPPSFE